MTFTLVPTPPFRLDLTVWALRRRAPNAIDRWDGHVYRRVLMVQETATDVALMQVGSRVRVELMSEGRLSREFKLRVMRLLERMLGLRTDLTPFYRLACHDPKLRSLAARFRGFKPPRFPSVFEALLNAFACQQLSITVGLELLNRLSERYGAVSSNRRAHAFPAPEAIAAARIGDLRRLGFNRAKSRGMIELARATTCGRLDLEALAARDDDVAVASLLALRGIGRWSAEYVLLRGLGRLHVFPAGDVGAQNALAQWLARRRFSSAEAVARALAPWKPWAGLIYFHLLLKGLEDRDQLT